MQTTVTPPVTPSTNASAKEGGSKRGPSKRVLFDVKLAKDASGATIPLTNEGKLTAAPANVPKTAYLGKAQFASVALFLNFKLAQAEAQLKKAQARVTACKQDIEIELKGGPSPEVKATRRLEKLRAAAAKLEAELKAQGISIPG